MMDAAATVIGLDVGDKRIGVARSTAAGGLAVPVTALPNDGAVFDALGQLAAEENASAFVVGFPRNMQGEPTAQSTVCTAFADSLRRALNLPVHLQDESLTSRKAEAELEARRKPFTKADIDALAATYILEDYFISIKEQNQ